MITRVFFDTEFTHLGKSCELLSIGLVSDCGKEFYAELNDYHDGNITDWVRENVLPHFTGENVVCKRVLEIQLRNWFSQFDQVELWSDCMHYDMVLFQDIFGGAFNTPSNIYYIPFDLSTLLKVVGVDPDMDRVILAGFKLPPKKHNALYDAKCIAACFDNVQGQIRSIVRENN
jgi:hypothetical protein